jgi:hypothetical protein
MRERQEKEDNLRSRYIVEDRVIQMEPHPDEMDDFVGKQLPPLVEFDETGALVLSEYWSDPALWRDSPIPDRGQAGGALVDGFGNPMKLDDGRSNICGTIDLGSRNILLDAHLGESYEVAPQRCTACNDALRESFDRTVNSLVGHPANTVLSGSVYPELYDVVPTTSKGSVARLVRTFRAISQDSVDKTNPRDKFYEAKRITKDDLESDVAVRTHRWDGVPVQVYKPHCADAARYMPSGKKITVIGVLSAVFFRNYRTLNDCEHHLGIRTFIDSTHYGEWRWDNDTASWVLYAYDYKVSRMHKVPVEVCGVPIRLTIKTAGATWREGVDFVRRSDAWNCADLSMEAVLEDKTLTIEIEGIDKGLPDTRVVPSYLCKMLGKFNGLKIRIQDLLPAPRVLSYIPKFCSRGHFVELAGDVLRSGAGPKRDLYCRQGIWCYLGRHEETDEPGLRMAWPEGFFCGSLVPDDARLVKGKLVRGVFKPVGAEFLADRAAFDTFYQDGKVSPMSLTDGDVLRTWRWDGRPIDEHRPSHILETFYPDLGGEEARMFARFLRIYETLDDMQTHVTLRTEVDDDDTGRWIFDPKIPGWLRFTRPRGYRMPVFDPSGTSVIGEPLLRGGQREIYILHSRGAGLSNPLVRQWNATRGVRPVELELVVA